VSNPHEAWSVETSRDGERWRSLGKGWVFPGEPLLVHGASSLIRFRRSEPKGDWVGPLERTADLPMTLLELEAGRRSELWPGEEHLGLPVLLPGGEVGRLVSFEHSPDGTRWTWSLRFEGEASDR